MDDHHSLHDDPSHSIHHDEDDADTASQPSISLADSESPRHSIALSDDDGPTTTSSKDSPNLAHEFLSNLKHDSHPYTLDTDFSSEADDSSLYTRDIDNDNAYDAIIGSPVTSAAPSVYDLEPKTATIANTYPPPPPTPSNMGGATPRADRESITSFASGSTTYSRKARPESTLVHSHTGPLVLGIALVDFNHLVGPRIEFFQGDIFTDEEVSTTLPFLALPDGAHLSAEDYSYFHLVPSSSLKPNPSTIFGISCNRQIASSSLLVKDPDVTRSTVQKAVVILASEPVFGPIRDKLGVVTRALFEQRDFSETNILIDFVASLETSLRSQLTESGLYMGTSLRELVHTFRQRTLVLLKALMLQKRIMFYGHPVERLCTYQYSLVSLLPGLLQTLADCGSPPLATRASTLTKPNSLKTSDRKSMMAYLGLPLDVFGKDAFFQPYIPLQQLDMIKETKSWLCGSTNSIVTGQKEIDLLVNIETGAFEFRDPKLERSAGLTPADRKWMDDIVRDVNEGWNDEDPTRSTGMQFKGSDDYLRTKFEEYVSAALASVRYRDFAAKGEVNGVMITGGSGGDANSTEDFNPIWISEFKKTNAFEVWDRTTDPMLFDIVEPRHPCNEKPTVVSDIGLRLSEGIQELKLEQQLAPTREAISRTITAGSTGFFKAVEGVRGRWQRPPGTSASASASSLGEAARDGSVSSTSISSTPVEVSPPRSAEVSPTPKDVSAPPSVPPSPSTKPTVPAIQTQKLPSVSRQQSSVDLSAAATHAAQEARAAVGAWGANIGSFWSTRASRFSLPRPKVGTAVGASASTKSSAAPSPVESQAEVESSSSSFPPPPLPPRTVEGSLAPVASTPPALPSRVKAAVAAMETHQAEPPHEEEHENQIPAGHFDTVHANSSIPSVSTESEEKQAI